MPDVLTVEPKPRAPFTSLGRDDDYTAEKFARTRPQEYRAAVGYLAAGRSPLAISRLFKCSIRTIYAIRDNKQSEIATARKALSEISRRVALRAAEELEDRLADPEKLAKIHTAALVPIYGVATDKFTALSQEQTQPTATLNVQVNLPDLYSEFIKVSQAIKQAVASDVTPVTLQLPDGDNDHQAHQVG